MKLPPLPLIDGCLFIDNSGWMEDMSTCPRSLEYKQLHKRIDSGFKSGMNFGSAQHLIQELRFAKYGTTNPPASFYEDVAVVLNDFYRNQEVPEGDWRTLNWAMTVGRKCVERYPNEEFSLLEYDKPVKCPYCNGTGYGPEVIKDGYDERINSCLWCNGTGIRSKMVELLFAVELFRFHPSSWTFLTEQQGADFERNNNTIPIIYTGRIDLPVTINGQASGLNHMTSIWNLDHKTTSRMDNSFWNDMRMSAQQRGYCWAFDKVTGQTPQGYIINAIRTKEPPLYVIGKGKGKQSPEEWWNESLTRERFEVSKQDLKEWESNTIDLVEEFFFNYQRDYMPQKTKWCSSYGACSYLKVCELQSQDRAQMLASGLFMDNTWSPLNQIK